MMTSTAPFENGFHHAIALWRSGLTWAAISHRPEYDTTMFGRGMYAAIEAMSGWLDVAEREARAWGVAPDVTERLIATARAA